jgi:hypothetical protein
MEQYLTTDELSKRIKMPPGSIRNLVWKNELKLNVHYVKPTPGKSCLCGAPSKNGSGTTRNPASSIR